jgi:hypothetical protein
MPNMQWKGTSNQATRRRIREIQWTRRERISAVLLALMAAAVAVLTALLASTIND